MAPLNEEDDEDEDSTVFDIKYRYGVGTAASSWAFGCWGGGMVHHGKQHRCGVCAFLFFGLFDLEVFCLWGEPL